MKCKNCGHSKGDHDVEEGCCNVLIREAWSTDYCPCIGLEPAKVSK